MGDAERVCTCLWLCAAHCYQAVHSRHLGHVQGKDSVRQPKVAHRCQRVCIPDLHKNDLRSGILSCLILLSLTGESWQIHFLMERPAFPPIIVQESAGQRFLFSQAKQEAADDTLIS